MLRQKKCLPKLLWCIVETGIRKLSSDGKLKKQNSGQHQGLRPKLTDEQYFWPGLILTLILSGEVKIDLANYDIKFWTNHLNIRFF
jgi:hypothetical protein